MLELKFAIYYKAGSLLLSIGYSTGQKALKDKLAFLQKLLEKLFHCKIGQQFVCRFRASGKEW